MGGTYGGSYLRLALDPVARGPVAREDVGYFFINSFLLSRIDSDLPSDLAEYDEDVNIYTAALLAGVVTGREDLLRADLVSTRDADVFARVQESKDQRLRYQVYKANADFLYVSLGVFNLIPIPPLDGSHVLETLLPASLADAYGQLRQFGWILLIGLSMLGVFRLVLLPVITFVVRQLYS